MAAEPLPLPQVGEPPRLSLAPEYPAGVPVPDPPIVWIGRDLHNTWDKVWNFVKSKADPLVADMQNQTIHLLAQAVPAIEAYVGESLKAMGGFINDVGDYATEGLTTVALNMASFASWAWESIQTLDVDLYNALTHINALEGEVVPALETAIQEAFNYAHDVAHAVGMDVEQWAMDHIYDPLIDDLGHLNRALVEYIDAKAAAVVDGMTRLLNDALQNVGAEGAAALALATQVAKWVDDCGEPMCEVMGPKTDLGKLLKAFQLAGILALLMEIGNMTEADVEARLRELAGDAQGIVSAFEGTFVGGGGSLRDFALGLL